MVQPHGTKTFLLEPHCKIPGSTKSQLDRTVFYHSKIISKIIISRIWVFILFFLF